MIMAQKSCMGVPPHTSPTTPFLDQPTCTVLCSISGCHEDFEPSLLISHRKKKKGEAWALRVFVCAILMCIDRAGLDGVTDIVLDQLSAADLRCKIKHFS